MSLKRKGFLMAACALLVCAALAGCMNANGRLPGANDGAQNGTASPLESPGASVMPQATSAVQTAYDWITGRTAVEEKINLLSEIETCRVVTTGSTALVGVTFAKEYKGEMTQRIQNLIAGVVKEADPNIQTVAVTSDEGDVQKVYSLSDQVRAGRTADELKEDINAIVRNATTLR